ncbi:uncharacterized protein TRIADDRAFT_25994 [Trichoplax adhaerens]|uniref:Pyridoxal kinase n=1 Tax=Trichoplax adhaerens TaxID=10228 RepID=B3RX60_TRIAD|nr:hypothetical protein TRIADDRAFT_25994 [Trichoplax adhaerens]EDV25249.1 hypothetical protein TRIADDRAFT_25994 [Trichoplax adhaerens]|eukprot:XP_002113139.1 hypothetical protein TRIADDRAFT_25994 [Trichoplax adhaerens]
MGDSKVLSIQSHVVHGYVGNRSATFPLQVLGFDVDVINSVQFSNHTEYGKWKGQILNATELWDLYEGLRENNLHEYSHLLTGYVGSESFLHCISRVIRSLKETNPNLIYVCDPVMGDNGIMYVPKELLPIYREEVIPLADIITPNQFEAEILTDVKIVDEKSAIEAMDILHSKGIKTVVISSSELGSGEFLIGYGSVNLGDGKKQRIKLEIPRVEAAFVGTGDLFASLLLAWTSHHPDSLSLACEKTISSIQNILKRTIAHARKLAGEGKSPNSAQLELRLVQSKHDIENPSCQIKAISI